MTHKSKGGGKSTLTTKGMQQFSYDFDIYDGEDPDKLSFDGTNVVSFQMINQGTSIVVINDGLRIYPKFSGVAPYEHGEEINKGEVDITSYRIKFIPLDFITFFRNIVPNGATGQVKILVDASPHIALLPELNRLLVISKVYAAK